ncbi:hypothetical protein DFH08DRAFT_1085863 [Mycena albidolilacea]|uniref:C2H2-type domain-containing protein n=1 Tax=Mycena albidolilacea TaxID=1033008 RepID=A0AAD6ZGF5_9AGAR|nr:hypothetical protein DFH08DRAFT_1085863 [Mycena albidolilacea]
MLLSIPVEDLFSSLIDITLGLTDKSLSCKFRPNVHHSGPAHESWTAISINIESSQGENGSVLTVSASKDETARPSTSAGKSPDFGRDFPLSNLMDIDHSAMSPLLSDTSPPQDYYSSLSGSPHSLGGLGPQHDLDFDFASGCLWTDTSTYSDFDTHHSSRLTGIAPACLTPSSDYVELTRSPSPRSSYTTSPAADVQSALASASTSVPPPSHTTFIACATRPSSDRGTSPALDTATAKTGRRAQYPCQHPSCSRILTSPYTRQVHMETHKVKPRKSFTCTMGCGEVFTRQHDRHRHEVALHGKKCTHGFNPLPFLTVDGRDGRVKTRPSGPSSQR